MDSSRFTVTLSSLDSIQKALRTSARNAGDAEDKVVSLSTCDNNHGWEDNAEIARENIEKARKKLSSVSPDLSNLAAQVGERKVLLQRLIQNPFVTGAFGSSDPLFVGLLSHSIYDELFFNPNRPPPPPKKKKGGGLSSIVHTGLDVVGSLPVPLVPSVASAIDSGLYLVEGDEKRAAEAGIGVVPGGKWLTRGVRAARSAKRAKKVGDKADDVTTASRRVRKVPIPPDLRDASPGLKALFAEGSLQGKPIINLRETLTRHGFRPQVITRNKKGNPTDGYLFENDLGEKVRVMRREGSWEIRVQNRHGQHLNHVGRDPRTRGGTHGIKGKSK